MTHATGCLHLSRLRLNPRSRQVISELSDPYEMHRTLMRAFPSKDQGGPGRVLFRVDVGRDDLPVVLVQSEKSPDWSFLSGKDYLLNVDDNPVFKPYDPKLHEGQRLRFLLRANPVIRRTHKENGDPFLDKDGSPSLDKKGKPKGRRIGLYQEAEQMEWLRRKADSGGFQPDAFEILPRGKQTSRRAGDTNTHLCVEFAGVLTVTDPEAFLDTLRSGIGSGKAFGFGLLSVAPVR